MSDLPARLLPDLVCGGAVMRLPVRGIAVLVRVEIFLWLSCHNLAHAPNRAIRALIPRRNDKLSAKSRKDSFALMRSAVRQTQFHRIAQRSRNHSIGDSCIAAGGIDNSF